MNGIFEGITDALRDHFDPTLDYPIGDVNASGYQGAYMATAVICHAEDIGAAVKNLGRLAKTLQPLYKAADNVLAIYHTLR